jgi:hypothetical protein
MLDVNRLRVIDAVARNGSVTAAAKELHYSQPSVTHHATPVQQLHPNCTPGGRGRAFPQKPKGAHLRAFLSIGETGFEPATARPPAGAIQAYPLRFSALRRYELR